MTARGVMVTRLSGRVRRVPRPGMVLSARLGQGSAIGDQAAAVLAVLVPQT
jgi:hypothetical protein